MQLNDMRTAGVCVDDVRIVSSGGFGQERSTPDSKG